MEVSYSWILPLVWMIIFFAIYLKLFKKQTPKNLPPGPPKLPLIGNLHQLASKSTLPHRRLAELARVYGPIMHLQLGEVSTIVISSSEMAKAVMKTHDAVLCDRPKILTAEVVFYNRSDIALAPYGEYWRQVRKVATLELFTARRVQSFRRYREEGLKDFIKALLPQVENGSSVINLSSKIFALSFDITLRLAINKKADDWDEFRKLVADTASTVSGFSIGDLYPSLGFISNISGMKRKLQDLVKRFDKLIDPIIEEHMFSMRQGKVEEGGGDLVDILLKFCKHGGNSNEFSLTTDNIKAIVFELFGAGGETSSTTIDWAFYELLKNPEAMEKAQNEVRHVLQSKELIIDEESIGKLKFLKQVVKETLRLHPPLPCLIPRESLESCEINGYKIPSRTRVFINAWTIGRDPKYWKNPEMFIPERFENNSVDYKGTYFELIPFGAGRRMCPGMGLGIATVELILAMLLYHFDWKLPDGIKAEDLDVNETFGIVARRKHDLHVIPILHSISGFNDSRLLI